MNRRGTRGVWRGPAPWAAGLLLVAGLLRADADAPPPGRSVEPEAVSSDAAANSAQLGGLAARIDAQTESVSRVAQALANEAAILKSLRDRQDRSEARWETLDGRWAALERRTQGLDERDAAAGVHAAEFGARLALLGAQFDGLKRSLAADQASLADTLAEVRKERVSLGRLDRLEELLGALQSDLRANDEELAEVQQDLKRLEPSPASRDAAWWEGVASWKYLPAVATGLATTALIWAASRR